MTNNVKNAEVTEVLKVRMEDIIEWLEKNTRDKKTGYDININYDATLNEYTIITNATISDGIAYLNLVFPHRILTSITIPASVTISEKAFPEGYEIVPQIIKYNRVVI